MNDPLDIESRRWSVAALAAFLLMPALLWLVGAITAQDVKQQLSASQPTVDALAMALCSFVLRMGAIVGLALGIYGGQPG